MTLAECGKKILELQGKRVILKGYLETKPCLATVIETLISVILTINFLNVNLKKEQYQYFSKFLEGNLVKFQEIIEDSQGKVYEIIAIKLSEYEYRNTQLFTKITS